MKIEFSAHALQRIESRQIPKEKVLETINNFDTIEGSFRSRKLFRKDFGGKILETITVKENNKIIIITAYYLYEN